jgi:hypothetical protein
MDAVQSRFDSLVLHIGPASGHESVHGSGEFRGPSRDFLTATEQPLGQAGSKDVVSPAGQFLSLGSHRGEIAAPGRAVNQLPHHLVKSLNGLLESLVVPLLKEAVATQERSSCRPQEENGYGGGTPSLPDPAPYSLFLQQPVSLRRIREIIAAA